MSYPIDLIISVINRNINLFQFNSYTVLPGSIWAILIMFRIFYEILKNFIEFCVWTLDISGFK